MTFVFACGKIFNAVKDRYINTDIVKLMTSVVRQNRKFKRTGTLHLYGGVIKCLSEPLIKPLGQGPKFNLPSNIRD